MAKTAGKSRRAPARRAKSARPRAAGAPPGAAGARGRKLVIVESPAKAKTINRYLGDQYVVRASMGHVRDLPQRKIGVDLGNGFEPTYEVLTGRRKVVADLKRAARAAEEIFLATDLDREGEAIAWHLAQCLGVGAEEARRVIFNEITARAIREAFAHPRAIDMDKVNAQQARRILDRIVGYELSPLLWRKVSPGLSAGRVQTVAVRLIVERERQIEAFQPEEYWKITAVLTADPRAAAALAEAWRAFLAQRDEKGQGPTREAQQAFLAARGAFQAELMSWRGQRFKAGSVEQAAEVAAALGLSVERIERRHDAGAKGAAQNVATVVGRVAADAPALSVARLSRRTSLSRPPAPFTTASLQQAAAARLRFSATRTMRIAQQLYEGVELGGEGRVGLITYMRTDSRHLAPEAVAAVRQLVAERFGPAYLPERPNSFGSAQRAQEAHEAIRPSDARRSPDELRGRLNDEQQKLYSLIWTQFVACQMAPARWEVTEADVAADTPAGQAVFKAMGRTLAFDGYLRVTGLPRGGEQILPELAEGRRIGPADISPTQHFTLPPPRYTEGSLVRALEADGIGRPSTYASIIQTIQDRRYVRLVNRAFVPTHLGKVVTDKLVAHFPKLFDVRFTARMEDQLDRVEERREDWVALLRDFYGPFHANLQSALESMVHAKAETQPSDYLCEDCGRAMVYRFSKSGRYLACTGYPDCKRTYPVDESGKRDTARQVDLACPKCGRAMVQRLGRFGPFLSCSAWPDCDGLVKLDRKGQVRPPARPPLTTDLPCPKCGSPLNLRLSRRGPWLSCSKYPRCRGRLAWTKLDEEHRKRLSAALDEHAKAHPIPTLRRLDGTAVERGYIPPELGAAAATPAAGEGEAPDNSGCQPVDSETGGDRQPVRSV